MKIVLAPDSFKESLTAAAVCEAIAEGLRSVLPDAVIDKCPVADGGEGTVDALVAATGGAFESTEVAGPLGEPVVARWGMLGDASATAVLEMAAASGLAMVPPAKRDPLKTTTFGTGQLIRAAMDRGAKRLVVGIGGSATTDGGMGCAQAFGIRFLDADGRALADRAGGADLARIERIDVSGLDPRIGEVEILVACDVDNPLCGPRGAAAVYGPQKGATPEAVRQLDANLAHLAGVVQRDLGIDIRSFPGAGAAGGLGAGLVGFLNGVIRPGIEIVIEAVRLAERLVGADLLITGEGRLDRQSVMGKVIAGVGGAARRAEVPAIALVGSVGEGAGETLAVLDAYVSIVNRPMPLDEALSDAAALLRDTAAQVGRLLQIGIDSARSIG
ncbi:MAG: glycerate kinase [Phycisphaerae bacterium]|nr:glycerate kinase [Phycisphaerae bacterium]